MKVTVLGDLHLFAHRSNGDEIFDSLSKHLGDSEQLIICGDLFDFRWSPFTSLNEAFLEASLRLSYLLEHIKIPCIYILGNHDGIKGFDEILDLLTKRYVHFQWRSDFYRVADTLFLHGDIPLKSGGEYLSPRKLKFDERIYSKLLQWGYTLCTRLKLTALFRKKMEKGSPLPLIDSAIDHNEAVSAVTQVIFGHTHFALKPTKFRKRVYHNCGTPMAGFRFQLIKLDL